MTDNADLAQQDVAFDLSSVFLSVPKPFRYRLKPGEAEELKLSPAMMRAVDLVNASQSELNEIEKSKAIAEVQVTNTTARAREKNTTERC